MAKQESWSKGTQLMNNRYRSLVALLAICIGLPGAVSAVQPLSHEMTAATGVPLTPNASWTITGDLHTARDTHTATLLHNGLVLVAGGRNSGSADSRSAELYDPATGTWTRTRPLHAGRFYHTATLLSDGRVLVVGGDSVDGERGSAELYDPASGTWALTGRLNVARQLHSATLLSDGRVLVAGGFDRSNLITSSVELYDPATGTWTVADSLATPRFSHTATLLVDGKVLVAGGFGGAGTTLTPTSTSWCRAPRPASLIPEK